MSILGGMQGHTGGVGIIFMCSSTDGGFEKINLTIKVDSLFDGLFIDKMKLKNILDLF